MSKIVFFGIPAHGHTNPTLGVVRELVARGHQVWYYSYNMVREPIQAAGATFVSCDDYDSQRKLSPRDAARVGKDMAFSTKLLVDTTLALDDKVCREMQELEPDCIVGDSMALWGKAVAWKLGIPYVCSTTTFAFNQHSARVVKQGLWELLKMILSASKTAKQVEQLREKGYPVKSVLDIIGSDEKAHTIMYTSPQFQPCSETFSDKYAFVGPSIRPAGGAVEKTRDKLVYLSMGTVNNDKLPFYNACLAAFAKTPYQVIMSVGNAVSLEELGPCPENISVFAQVDQIAVLTQADAFVSHCGMNSVSESLYFGVPLVLVPQTAEQRGVAHRVGQLGAGIEPDRENAAAIVAAVDQLFADDSYARNAAAISEGFHRCPGAKGAADKILQVCEGTAD